MPPDGADKEGNVRCGVRVHFGAVWSGSGEQSPQGRHERAAIERFSQKNKRSAIAGEALHHVGLAESANDEHAEIGPDGADLRPCIHAAFVYSSCAGEFVFESEDFSNRTMDMDPDDLDFSEPQKALAKLGYGNSMLAIQITYGGMACGPVWFTDVYGFDYGTLTAE